PTRSKRSRTWACSPGAPTSWTARTTTATEMTRWTVVALMLALAAASAAAAQDIRERTRLVPRGTVVNQAQAETLTLTVGAVPPRLVQTWIRAAGTIDKTNEVISAGLAGPDAALVKVGQRARAFPPSAKSSMYQCFVTKVVPRPGGASVEVSLAATG